MKRRKTSRINTEEAIKLTLTVDRPIDSKAAKKLLSKIAKCDFVAEKNSNIGEAVSPREICDSLLSLIESWYRETSIALLLINILQKILKCDCWGAIIGAELCKPPCSGVVAIASLLADRVPSWGSDAQFKTAVCELLLVLLNHAGDVPERMGHLARLEVIENLLRFASDYKRDAQVVEISFASLYKVFLGSSVSEKQKFSVPRNIGILVAACNEHQTEGT
eukprot:gene5394-6067_t